MPVPITQSSTMLNVYSDAAVIFLTALSLFLMRRYTVSTRAKQGLLYPPGPNPLPFIGNMRDVPLTNAWLTYTKWQKDYGDIVHATVLGQHIIIVNSTKIASDLFEKRALLYSDRPSIPAIDLLGWGFTLIFMQYSAEEWRIQRRLLDQSFRPQAAVAYRPLQLQKIHDYLNHLLENPGDFDFLTRSLSAAIIMKAVYGYDINTKKDYFVEIAEKAVGTASNSLIPGVMLVNAIPALRHIPEWLPGGGFKKVFRMTRKLVDEMQNLPLEFAKNNADTSCMVNKLLENPAGAKGDLPNNEEFVKHVAASAYAAGADTTVSATVSAIMAMVLHPKSRKKAQAEIDKVTGGSRLPDFNDRLALPYVEAFYRELMRWRPVLPLGLVRATSDNDTYKGYFIPKGAMVIPNIWAMTHDENKYTDPDTFNPDRFLTPDGTLNDDDNILAFGFGRRICVGKPLGDATTWATIVSLLAVFDFDKAKNEEGKLVEIEGKYSNGVISHPLPFKCSITPRSEIARRLVIDSATPFG